MVRCWLFILLLCGLLLPVPSFAGEGGINLEQEHGEYLDDVPFVIRYKYLKATGKEWAESDYLQREDFLIKWYGRLEADKETQKREDRQQAVETRKEDFAKRMELRKKLQKEREQKRLEKYEEWVKKEEKRQFQRVVDKREEDLERLRENQRKCLKNGTCF